MKVFLTSRAYWTLAGLCVLFVVGYYLPLVYRISQLLFFAWAALLFADALLLFRRGQIEVIRSVDDRLSNGLDNHVKLSITSHYPLGVSLEILEELPDQLQVRDFKVALSLKEAEYREIVYTITPKVRGAYAFGCSNMMVKLPFPGLLVRRIKGGSPEEIKVYPAFAHLHQYELAAISNQLVEVGEKQIQKVGNSQEFDSIRAYVLGDDPRHINWKATARRQNLQVNHYIDEKSQGVYCLIDKSRSMKMPFAGMTLLDYSINASLVLSYIALNKSDRAGLVTFEDKPHTFIKAANRPNQIHQITEALYREETSFQEVDFTSLYTFTHGNIPQRSLLLLFTNFESIHSLERQLGYLRMINRKHLLLVVFFRNTELDKVAAANTSTVQGIYNRTIALQMLHEKRLIAERLNQAGIMHLYTSPGQLT
ncbi:MAG: DUF58 domain-containing protein, partial [Bacteroidota bacterium]